MDAARAYERYISARIRLERLSAVQTRLRSSVKYASHCRLVAGGRLPMSNCNFLGLHNEKRNSPKSCECKETMTSGTALERVKEEPNEMKNSNAAKEHKPKSKRKFKCKYPMFVVKSKTECDQPEEDALPSVRFRHSPLKRGVKRITERPKCQKDMKESPAQAKQIVEPIEEKPKKNIEPTDGKPKNDECTKQAPCAECSKVTQMSLQLFALKRKLEDQVRHEIQHKYQLNAINDQLKQLTGTVHSLNEKCQALETEKDRSLTPKPETSRKSVQLENQTSSQCQFCRHQILPVLSSMHRPLFNMLGQRDFTDVALSILLRADNVYHVNVRDLETGLVLGCMLVNEAGIKEANCLGLFQQILTFYVTDSTNDHPTANIFGGINFELIRDDRLSGGKTQLNQQQLNRDMELNRKSISQLTFDWPISHKSAENLESQKSYIICSCPTPESSITNLPASQEMIHINNLHSCLLLSDDETEYPVTSIRFASQMEPYTDQSEPDKPNNPKSF